MLKTTEASLERHFISAGRILRDRVDRDSGAKLTRSWHQATFVVTLIGTEHEFTERTRGPGKTPVVRTVLLGAGLWAWISYREEWDSARQVGATRYFLFRSVQLAVYFGYRNNVHKPQMFRAEWTIDEGNRRHGDFANPHWHFDALESLRRGDAERRATGIAATLRAQAGAKPRDFSPSVRTKDVRDVVSIQKLSRLHFASAASWWRGDSASHVHDPKSVGEIRAWLHGTLSYLNQELGRLVTTS